MSKVKTGVGTQDIILGLIWGRGHRTTIHKNRLGHCTLFRIRGDIAQENVFKYLYWGGDTAHNTTYYSESGGGHRTELLRKKLVWSGWGRGGGGGGGGGVQ